MSIQNAALGTRLRHLIELLDGDVQTLYDQEELNYRPRYTPVVRAIEALGPASVRAIADHAGMTHSAVSQTVGQMVRAELVAQDKGRDGRERIVRPTAKLTEMVPRLHALWAATDTGARALDAQLSAPLSALAQEAIVALEARPFLERIRAAKVVAC